MFKKIFKFLKGYVIIEIRGKNKEHFINMCINNQLDVYEIIPHENCIILKTDFKSFRLMRRLVFKSKVRIKIISKHGLKLTAFRYRRRLGFFICGICVCIFFLIIPQYILCIEIEGAYNSDKSEILNVLKEHGVYTGGKKKDIDDLGEIKNAVVFGVDGINWAWLYQNGAKMTLKVQESVMPPKIRDKNTPVDIIAACDGYVVSADVFCGEKHICNNSTVNRGQLLVSSKTALFYEGFPENYKYVHSSAKIIAETIRTDKKRFKSSETLRIKTGQNKYKLGFEFFGKHINLFKNISCGFNDYDIKEIRKDLELPVIGYIGVSAYIYNITEVNVCEHSLTEEEILKRAKEELEKNICKTLCPDAVKQSEKLNFSEENGIYTVELKMYLRENIGIEIPAKE